nr:PAS domain S-box protein [Desulfobacula sp.]
MHKPISALVWILFFIIPSLCSGSDSNINLSPEEKAWLNEHHTVRVRIGHSPPFMLTDGKIRGISIDYLVHIFNTNGIRFQYVSEADVSWPQALEYIKRHEIVDMVPTAKITEARKKDMIFTDEYIFAPWVIFTRTDSDFISSIDDLNGKTVAVEEGYVMHQRLKQDYPQIKLKVIPASLKNYAEMPVKDLSAGLADAYIGNLLSTTYTIQTRGYANVKVAAPTPFDDHNQAMAIRSDWPELAGIINQTMAAMTSDEHAAIRNRWLSIRYEYGINKVYVLKWVIGVTGVASLLLGFVLIRNRRLKSEADFRKTIETALRESEERYRSLIDFSPLPFLVTQEEKIVFANPSVISLFGAGNKDEIIGTSPDDWIHSEFTEQASQRRHEVLEEGKSVKTTEMCLIRRDGRKIFVLANTSCIRYQGKPALVSAFQDITESKRADELLRESEARFKALHNASFGGIAIHDKGVILECNQGLSEMTGYSMDELIGMDGLLLIAEKSRPVVMDNILSGYEKPYEALGLRKNGEEFPIHLEARNIPYKGKQVRTTEFRDISERKQAESERAKLQEQLTQAQKMESVGRLAGGVAHDFNNMLGVILGHAELALEQTEEHYDIHSHLEEIQNAAKRSAELTKQLLTFARKQIIEPKMLNLNQTVKQMITMLQRLIGEDIDLLWKPAKNLWPVKMDPSQIDQILANLCVNARDAITGVGKITIETDMVCFDEVYCTDHAGFIPGDFVLLGVSDNGSGMDKETLGNLFEPFFTTKEMGKGTGLGLATVYGIVKQNKGFINVYSEPGQGTVFKIYLPRFFAADQISALAHTEKKIPSGNETILLVEDEPAVLKLTRVMLERKGYSVMSAATPVEAMALAGEHTGKIHLLMTDVVMPGMNGRDLARRLTAIHPDIKLLFMSGYTANVIAHQGVLDEGVAFIQKPFSMADLAEKVRGVLDKTESAAHD